MKRIPLLIVLFALFSMTTKAQLKVTGFELLPNDLSGRTLAGDKAIVDMDGETCALIKVMTIGMSKMQRDKLKFTAGSMATYIAKTDYSNDRFIKVYVGPNKGTLIIYHESYGEVKYSLPSELKSQTTYKLELELETVSLKIIVTPEDAEVNVDGELIEIRNGVVLMEVSSGSEHTIDVSCDYYRPDKKVVTADSNTEVKIDLLPFYGYLSIVTNPEVMATIKIDDKEVGTTPYLSKKMNSGEYRIQLIKDNYLTVNEIANIGGGKKTVMSFTMKENFARPTITTSNDAEIWVNGGSGFDKKGIGEWNGILAAGDYTIEARKNGCRTTRQYVTLTNGQRVTKNLDAPKPMLGSINIKSNPSGAIITLNNIQKGVTPTTLNNISVGEYNVVLSKDGYGTAMQTVTVIENQTVNVNLTLVNGRNITINSEPAGANVYVDGTYLGTTPLTKQIAFGSHNLKVSLDGEEKSEAINVSEGGKSSWSFDVRKPKGSIGSLYTFNDGSKGIVFYRDFYGHGLVVSLDERNLRWSKSESDIRNIPNEMEFNKSLNKGLGATYTTYIINQLGKGEAPAAEWCRNKGSEWYLPSAGELWQLIAVANEEKGESGQISKALISNGGTELNKWYWSSSEYSYGSAWNVIHNGPVTNGYKYRNTNYSRVRAIRAF